MLIEPSTSRYVDPLMPKLLFLTAVVLSLLLLLWLREDEPRSLVEPARQEVNKPAAADPLPSIIAHNAPSAKLKRIQRDQPVEEINQSSTPEVTETLALILRLFDAETLQPVSGALQLWRVNLPENEQWTAGDRLVLETKAQDGRLEVPNLTAGDYRVHCLFAVEGSPASAAFRLQHDQQQVELKVTMPRKEEAHITWVSSNGALLGGDQEILERQWAGNSSRMNSHPDPVWAQERRQKIENEETMTFRGRGAGGRFGSRSHQSWRAQIDGEGRYPLNQIEQNSRLWKNQSFSRWRRGGREDIRLSVSAQGTGEYAAVFLEPKEVQQQLRFPAGFEPHDVTSEIQILCEAVPFGLNPQQQEQQVVYLEQAWQRSTVSITLDVPEYAPVSLTWRPIDGPLPVIALLPRTPSEESD